MFTRVPECLNSVFNVKALVGAFNQEKALVVGSFSMIVKTDGPFTALLVTRRQAALNLWELSCFKMN